VPGLANVPCRGGRCAWFRIAGVAFKLPQRWRSCPRPGPLRMAGQDGPPFAAVFSRREAMQVADVDGEPHAILQARPLRLRDQFEIEEAEELRAALLTNGRSLEETRANIDGLVMNPAYEMIYWAEVFRDRISLHAAPLLEKASIFSDLPAALDDLHLTIATTRRSGAHREVPPDAGGREGGGRLPRLLRRGVATRPRARGGARFVPHCARCASRHSPGRRSLERVDPALPRRPAPVLQ